MMVSDSCSNAIALTLPSAAAFALAAPPGQTPTHLLSALLLHQSGDYDFGGSRPPRTGDKGEFGAYYDYGGIFTDAFFEASVYCQDTSEGWNSLFKDASNRIPQGPITFRFNLPGGGTRDEIQQGQHPFPFPTR